MKTPRSSWLLLPLLALAGCMPPSWGAAALLHPSRRALTEKPPLPAEEVVIESDGVSLKGWLFRAQGERRGTVVYLHGAADNRASVKGVAKRYVPRGYDVLAYDSRAHGSSTGDACTYGFYEKRDLAKAIDQLGAPTVAVIGVSLGAAVALQAAAEDARISRVVAISSFSDLRAIASDRAPFFASAGNVREALTIAEGQAHFVVDEVSPVRSAGRLAIPVLLIHGTVDEDTKPVHSERVFAALKDPRRLLLIPNGGHPPNLDEATWRIIDEWLTPG
jgi:alpha-beta hydrolase superfamily lysophospholipase